MRTITLLLLLFLVFNADAFPKQDPDLVILNAKIFTATGKKVRDGGIAIKDGRIIAVDKTYKIRDKMVRTTRRIDANGRLVVPGFNDSHTHFMAIGNLFSSVNLRDVRDSEEVPQILRRYVRYLPKGRWILGGNWNNNDWTRKQLPTRHLIDAVTPENPVFIYSSDPEIALANSLAMRISGIDKKKIAPEGGSIDRDQNGDATGILRGTAILLVRGKVPKLATREEFEVAETATNYAAALGVTSVTNVHTDDVASVFRSLRANGKLKTRVYDCLSLNDWKQVAETGLRAATGDSFVRTGCLKGFAPTDDDAVEQLYEEVLGADRAGLQVLVHSIGQSANRNILDIFERVAQIDGKRDRRFKVEHAAGFRMEDLKRFEKGGFIASMQPHLFGGYQPYRSLLKSDAILAFGSDASITDFDPMLGIDAAVNRGSADERLSVEDAVRLYTEGSAYAEFQEKEKGTIEIGKLADLAILSSNIFEIPSAQIRDTFVVMTFMNGEIVFDKRYEN